MDGNRPLAALGPDGGPLRFVDLFAGIGGFHQALSDLGAECVLASEIDADAQDVYAKAFPDTQLEGDIVELTERQDPATAIPSHDLLCAGFPCQPFSKSGFQRGMDETRGTLFFNILRVLEAHRPRWIILENVRNLAGPRQRETWAIIIRNLRRLGYQVSAEPMVLSPHHLPPEMGGRPQVRDRVFICGEYVGAEVSQRDVEPLLPGGPIEGWDPHAWRIEDWLQDDSDIPDIQRYRLSAQEVRWIEAWNAFVQAVDADHLPGFPFWVSAFQPHVDTTGAPPWKADFLRKNSAFYLEHQSTIDDWLKEYDVRSFPPSRQKFEWQARRQQPEARQRDLWQLVMHLRPSGLRVKPATYLPALVAITQTSIIGSRRRRITPVEAARLQGLPDDHPLHPIDAKAYKQLGNGVNVGVVSLVARSLIGPGRAAQVAA